MSIAEKIHARFNQKAAEIGYRTDLSINDIRPHSTTAAALLLTYNPTVGEIDAEQIGTYFQKTFDCKISPILATARKHNSGVLTVIAELITKKRPFKDSKKMLALGSANFIDTVLNETYQVRTTNKGTKYLSKVSSDNIQDIIAERNKRMAVANTKQYSFEEINAGVAIVDKGDTVKFFYLDRITEGKITNVFGDKVNIQCAQGKVTVEKTAILEMLRKSPKAIKEAKGEELEFYTKMYGDKDFAKKIVGM